MSSQRVIDGFRTKGSSAGIVFPQEFSGSNTLQKYDQGIYVNDINVLIGVSTTTFRPNNDFLKFKGGKRVQVTEGEFDDTEAPTSILLLSSSSSLYEKSQISLGFFSNFKKMGEKGSGYNIAPSHFLLDNDFGIPDTYQDGSAYEDIENAIDPIRIIVTDPADLIVPSEIVNSNEMISIDGAVDIFDTRKLVDRSFLEIPFRMRGPRGDLVNSDQNRFSVTIEDQTQTVTFRKKHESDKLRGIEPYLDASDQFGLADVSGTFFVGPASTMGYVNEPSETAEPYVDATDFDLIGQALNELPDILSASYDLRSNFATHEYLNRNHVSLRHGFVYDYSTFGIDSLAFGGLLK